MTPDQQFAATAPRQRDSHQAERLQPHVQRDDLEASLRVAQAQPDLTPALVDSFADRVESEIAHRARLSGVQPSDVARRSAASRNQLVLGLISLVMAVPLSAIGATQIGLLGFVIAWVGIVAVNLAHAVGVRRG